MSVRKLKEVINALTKDQQENLVVMEGTDEFSEFNGIIEISSEGYIILRRFS